MLSCIKIDEVSTDRTNKFAVVCLVSPTDSLITAFVSTVIPINQEFKASDVVVKNAKVSISSAQQKIQLIFVDSTQRYQITTRNFVNYDTQYELLVEIPNQMPLKASCRTLKEINPNVKIMRQSNNVLLEVNWRDSPNEQNVYSISATYWNKQLRRLSNSIDWEGIARSSLRLSDEGFTGAEMVARGNVAQSSSISDTTKFNLVFTNIDQNTTDFLDKRSAQYNQNQANQQSVLDFISNATQKQNDLSSFFERFKEPVLLSSNIENGLGYFGSYYRIVAIIK
jgi:hypothetical protein